jgi:primosomal replication protein N
MNDANGAPAAEVETSELGDEISRSMGSVWARHTGARPDSISTEISADKIRCVIEGSTTPPVDDEAEAQVAMLLTATGQKSEAIESVRRATHRRVVGFISKRDDKAGTSTQTFILDARRAKN